MSEGASVQRYDEVGHLSPIDALVLDVLRHSLTTCLTSD